MKNLGSDATCPSLTVERLQNQTRGSLEITLEGRLFRGFVVSGSLALQIGALMTLALMILALMILALMILALMILALMICAQRVSRLLFVAALDDHGLTDRRHVNEEAMNRSVRTSP